MKNYINKAAFFIFLIVITVPMGLAAQSSAQVNQWAEEGMKAWEDGRYAEALLPLLQAVEAGNPDAQTYLGRMYRDGTGVKADTARAVELFRKAAAQGQPSAMVSLGYLYRLGRYLKQDYQEAVKWFRKSATLGYSSGQNNLAKMHLDGLGVPQNYEKAFEWYRKAAEQGYAMSQNNLAYRYMYGEGVPQNIEKARDWFKKAVEGGYDDAIAYEHGEKVTIPVFERSNPSASLERNMQKNDTYVHFNKNSFTPFIRDEELYSFRKAKNTSSVELIQNGTYTTLKHQPKAGYSEWTFPNFAFRR